MSSGSAIRDMLDQEAADPKPCEHLWTYYDLVGNRGFYLESPRNLRYCHLCKITEIEPK